MRCVPVEVGPGWHDARRVHHVVALIVVPLGMIGIDGLADARPLVQVTGIGPEVGVVGEAADIALEVAVIDHVEAIERRPEAPVGLCRRVPVEEARAKVFFCLWAIW